MEYASLISRTSDTKASKIVDKPLHDSKINSEHNKYTAAIGLPLFLQCMFEGSGEHQAEDNVNFNNEVQTKLTVGEPDDEFEKEADRVADEVMRTPENAPMEISSPNRFSHIQTKINDGVSGSKLNASMANRIASPGAGLPLHASIRNRIEPVLAADLSHVQVHKNTFSENASRQLNAKAFTHGNNIFLGENQSTHDLKLMSHETTHVLQQCGSQRKSKVNNNNQIQSTNSATIQRADLHQGASVPDASGQQAITTAMNPQASVSSTGAVTIRTWGGTTAPGASPTFFQLLSRMQTLASLIVEIRAALDAELAWIRPMAAQYAAHHVPPSDLQGAGNAAADVVRSHVGGYIRNSVGGPTRIRHGFTAGTNLLDAYDTTDRQTAGERVSAEAVVWWAVRNTPAANTRSTFAFNPDNRSENNWLANTAVARIIGTRRADFELWDRFGFAMVGRIGNTTLATTMPDTSLSTTAPSGGGLSPAHRALRWSAFAELMHEFFHLVEHPSHVHARENSSMNSALHEGVTDILTEDTYNSKVSSVRSDAALITRVEGAAPAAGITIPTSVLPARYQIAYPTEVADVRAALGSMSLDSFKAAYLAGHVEYEGLEPSGADRTPVAMGTGQGVDIPPSVTTLAALATASGNSQMRIWLANYWVTSWAPLPRRLNVPGWREHVVVATPGGTTETLAQIAAQRGVSVADLNFHNRFQSGWPTLTAGMKVLIPPAGFRP